MDNRGEQGDTGTVVLYTKIELKAFGDVVYFYLLSVKLHLRE